MKIRSQVGMVLNLDKCIGCHTCSVTCKNVWTSREGMEYAWFNNVESKPVLATPKNGKTKPNGKVAGFATLTAQSTQKSGANSAFSPISLPTQICQVLTTTTNRLTSITNTYTPPRLANTNRLLAHAH